MKEIQQGNLLTGAKSVHETFEEFLARIDELCEPRSPLVPYDVDPKYGEQIGMHSACRGPVGMAAFASVGPLAELGS